jgi:CheY-like chemotaxis protein
VASASRILFVDDEPILQDLYGSMEPELKDYEVFTANCGQEGLRFLGEHKFDVVVTDLAMPGMDGIEFLSKVVDSQPDSVRIVISGYADQIKIAQCLSVGHRYFNKPCDLPALVTLLRRLAQFRNIVSNPKIRNVIGGLGSLPVASETYLKLSELLGSSYASLDDVAEVVERDPVVTARLLQLVNSALFGFPRRFVSAREAVQFLGTEMLHALVLGLKAY